jgi:hypothetical protein
MAEESLGYVPDPSLPLDEDDDTAAAPAPSRGGSRDPRARPSAASFFDDALEANDDAADAVAAAEGEDAPLEAEVVYVKPQIVQDAEEAVAEDRQTVHRSVLGNGGDLIAVCCQMGQCLVDRDPHACENAPNRGGTPSYFARRCLDFVTRSRCR